MQTDIKDAPAFDFYPERWLVGTAHMSDAEQLSYLKLLCQQWLMQGLPDDVKALKRMAGKGVTQTVLDKLPVDSDGKRRNKRLEIVRLEQRERIKKSRERIAKMNEARLNKKRLVEHLHEPLQERLQEPHKKPLKGVLTSSSPLTTHPVLLEKEPKPTTTKAAPPSGEVKDSRHGDVMRSWGERFLAIQGFAYVCNGGRDGTALKRFLQTIREPAETILNIAEQAWRRAKTDPFAKHCKQAATIAGLCSSWNSIRAELTAQHDRQTPNVQRRENDSETLNLRSL